MDEQQRERFEAAVEKKKRDAEAASRQTSDTAPDRQSSVSGDQQSIYEDGRSQDTPDPRAKNTGHGKKTADKWNQ